MADCLYEGLQGGMICDCREYVSMYVDDSGEPLSPALYRRQRLGFTDESNRPTAAVMLGLYSKKITNPYLVLRAPPVVRPSPNRAGPVVGLPLGLPLASRP